MKEIWKLVAKETELVNQKLDFWFSINTLS